MRDVDLNIKGWSVTDNAILRNRAVEFLELARDGWDDLPASNNGKMDELMRWARLKVLCDLDWDIDKKIDGAERLATWAMDKLYWEKKTEQRKESLKAVSEGW